MSPVQTKRPIGKEDIRRLDKNVDSERKCVLESITIYIIIL